MKKLTLVLTDHWFEEIKSGRKTHEYRVCSEHWYKRLGEYEQHPERAAELTVRFQKAYRKNPERMTFAVKSVTICNGLHTDLHTDSDVFDIELGEVQPKFAVGQAVFGIMKSVAEWYVTKTPL